MDNLIPIVNKLQDVFAALGTQPIDLPQIVVVGAQSSGKSSVLEQLVGRDFLPRGAGICTRRPLVLQLVHDASSTGEDRAQFLHRPDRIFTNFDDVRHEIVAETDRTAGRGKCVSHAPIHLRVTSPSVVNLTLVDLPGLTRNPVGDQPADIEQQLEQMVMEYITKPRALILAVQSATDDIANSVALQMARRVDPRGDRTLGVLTKIDLMDDGTDCLDVLLGRVVPLKLGFVGVVNRSQKDIDTRKAVTEAQKDERDFFARHLAYRDVAQRCGSAFLRRQLSTLLLRHIRAHLPQLKLQIAQMLTRVRQELESYGAAPGHVFHKSTRVLDAGDEEASPEDIRRRKRAVLMQALTAFREKFSNAIDVRHDELSGAMDVMNELQDLELAPDLVASFEDDMRDLYGGARLSHIFHQIFVLRLSRISPFDGLSDAAIRTANRNATGTRPALFVPETSFELLVKQQIKRLEQPSVQCCEMVHEELKHIAKQVLAAIPEMRRFPQLRQKLCDVVFDLFRKHLNPAAEFVRNLVECELAYVNTNHPDFIGGSRAVQRTAEHLAVQKQQQHQQAHLQPQRFEEEPIAPTTQATPPQQPRRGGGFLFWNNSSKQQTSSSQSQSQSSQQSKVSQTPPVTARSAHETAFTENEQVAVEIIKQLIASYFGIVRKNVLDTVPKAIMNFLVLRAKKGVEEEVIHVYEDADLDELLKEDETIADKRRECQQMLRVLAKASDIVNSVEEH